MQIQGSAMKGEGSERLESLHVCGSVEVAFRMKTFGTFESCAVWKYRMQCYLLSLVGQGLGHK